MATTRSRRRPDTGARPNGHQAAPSFAPFIGAENWAWSGAPIAANTALAGVQTIRASLEAWRRVIDASRTMIRGQQDAMFEAVGAQLSVAAAPPAAARRRAPRFEAGVFDPVAAAANTYEEMSNVFLEAQRSALEAFAGSRRTH